MILKTLMQISDKSLTMALFSERETMNGKKKEINRYRYNFEKGYWDFNTIIDDENLTTVGEFMKSDLYQKYKNSQLVTWSLLDPKKCKGIVNEDKAIKFERNLIFSISIRS